MKNRQTFPLTTLGEVADFTNGGAWTANEYVENGIPVVRVTDMVNGTIDLSNCKYLSFESKEKYKKHILYSGDIIIATVGSHPTQPGSVVGRVSIVPKQVNAVLLNQNAVRITPVTKNLDKEYLAYLGKSNIFQKYIIKCARGSANQVRMSIELLRIMPIPLPTLPIQRRIATILSAYDELIENNSRRIKILEEMARMIYQEWFVKFRFPGHKQAKFVESPLGMIPARWEVKKLGELILINKLSIVVKNAPKLINYIDIASVSVGIIEKIEEIEFDQAPGRARRIVKHGDIIWSCVRPNRKSYSLILNPIENLIVSTGFAVLTPVLIPYTYLYQCVTTDNFVGYLTNSATGAAYPAVNTEDFKNAEILLPDEKLLNLFHEIVYPLFVLKQNLLDHKTILKQTRDMLLPKLISGEIDVSNLDIPIEER